MKEFKLDISKVYDFVSPKDIDDYSSRVKEQVRKLHDKTGEGNDYLGWLNLPSSITEAEIVDIEKTASDLSSKVEFVVVIGIGGSY
ncbi:MAG: glucose-6-phosphate isomerase, partial [Bacteroidales bacterium]